MYIVRSLYETELPRKCKVHSFSSLFSLVHIQENQPVKEKINSCVHVEITLQANAAMESVC